MVITREISVDVAKRNVFSAIVAKQLDNNSRFLKVTITNLGEKLSVDATSTVVINALREDGLSKAFLGEANADGTVTVPLTLWMLELDGEVKCDISVVGTEDRKLTTMTFILAVEAANYSGDEIADDENYDLLVSLLSEVAEYKTAEAERVANETTRQSNETTRQSNETTRKSNETYRNTAERERATAETARADTESVRVFNENTRISSESTRVSSEQSRVSAETVRDTNETDRKNAETGRVNAENGRVTDEDARVNAENARCEAENTRDNKEQERITAEISRKSAETSRDIAEKARVDAETARASAEDTRVSNEEARQTAETLRQTNTANAIEKTEAATQAALEVVGQVSLENRDEGKQYTYKLFVENGYPGIELTEVVE